MAFIAAMVFSIFAYGQIYNTLPVYLRDVYNLLEGSYGTPMSLTTLMEAAELEQTTAV